MKKLKNKNCIITGASRGLGEAIAKMFVEEGANVFLCARNIEDLKKVQNNLNKISDKSQKIEISETDISKENEVDKLFKNTEKILGKIDVLVNNAGIYGPLGLFEDNDWKEWVKAIEINLYGTVYPCKAIIPYFKKHNKGKIINLSGGGATNPLPRISSYATSKAGVVRFSETLALELKDYNIDVNCIAPGALLTKLNENLLKSDPKIIGKEFYEKMKKLLETGGTPLEKGAGLAVYLASDESNGITGKLISAPWDPWNKFDEYREELNSTDIYTLRRITEKDRGKNWV